MPSCYSNLFGSLLSLSFSFDFLFHLLFYLLLLGDNLRFLFGWWTWLRIFRIRIFRVRILFVTLWDNSSLFVAHLFWHSYLRVSLLDFLFSSLKMIKGIRVWFDHGIGIHEVPFLFSSLLFLFLSEAGLFLFLSSFFLFAKTYFLLSLLLLGFDAGFLFAVEVEPVGSPLVDDYLCVVNITSSESLI